MAKQKYLSPVIPLIVLILQSIGMSFAAAPESVPDAAPQKSLVHLSLAQSASFSDALDALAAQGHVAIVAEGAPLVPRLPKKDTQDLTAPRPLPEAVTKVAASFDYDAQKQDKVYILGLSLHSEDFQDFRALLSDAAIYKSNRSKRKRKS